MANGHGGTRQGAGRPKGSANKKTAEVRDRAAKEGITPLEYMLKVLRESKDEAACMEAAKAAAPYLHPKLASTEITGSLTISHEEALKELE